MSRLVFGWLTGFVAGLPLRMGYAVASWLTELHFRLFPARRHAASSCGRGLPPAGRAAPPRRGGSACHAAGARS